MLEKGVSYGSGTETRHSQVDEQINNGQNQEPQRPSVDTGMREPVAQAMNGLACHPTGDRKRGTRQHSCNDTDREEPSLRLEELVKPLQGSPAFFLVELGRNSLLDVSAISSSDA